MKNLLILCALVLSAALFLSFSKVEPTKESVSVNYSFTKSGSAEVLIQLKLNSDNTFLFIDNSNPKKHISTEGKYILKGHAIKLYDYDSKLPIAEKWTMEKKYACIKSRKALTWTRICQCN